jgi:hypothetical protein
MSSRKVILVDGPGRGQVAECDGPVLFAPRQSAYPWPLDEGEQSHPLFSHVAYSIHRVSLFGRLIYVGSTRYPPHDADLFEALASNDAKNLAQL